MIGPWALFPALLLGLALGCGLLLERLARVRVPGALLIPLGLAAIVVAGSLTTATDATAELTAPLAAALAVAGFASSSRWRSERPDPWVVLAATVVFGVYGAPVLLSGEATFAGYIRLDDVSTWLALTDRIMEHGHSLEGLAPSTYEATLAFNLGDGYPVGAFVPLGIGRVLTGIDPAWLSQPYMSVLAACIVLCLWEILGPLVPRRPLRAVASALAAQPALLVGYAQWGGVKEVAAAALVALTIALVPRVLDLRAPGGLTALLGVAVAALLAVLSLGGAIWVLPALAAGGALLWRRVGGREALRRAGATALVAGVLSLPLVVPALVQGQLLPPTSSSLAGGAAKGNLIEPLGLERLFGIWPAGDFRLDAVNGEVTSVLIVVVALAALSGLWCAARWSGLGLALYGGGILAACLLLVAIGSPWVHGKALATASPAVLALATSAVAVAISRGYRLGGGVVMVVIAAGVLWSNALAYRDANLAPRGQLAELERIGELIDGQGPTLMTEYQPYGARHFLRAADPEAVSELRRRSVPQRGGALVEKGRWADTDDLALRGLMVYRTFVLRRSPLQSRPPAPYALTFSGHYYQVWQRPLGPGGEISEHLPLGGGVDVAGVAPCDDLRRLARRARQSDGTIAYVEPPRPVALPVSELDHPGSWPAGDAGTLVPRSDGSASGVVSIPRAGSWHAWLSGSVRGRIQLLIDGRLVGSVRHLLNNAGLYVELGSAALARGRHALELRYTGASLLHPGSGGTPAALGPLVLTSGDPADGVVRRAPPSRVGELCGRRLDWVETLP
jgi:hypothetical protein